MLHALGCAYGIYLRVHDSHNGRLCIEDLFGQPELEPTDSKSANICCSNMSETKRVFDIHSVLQQNQHA